MAGEAVDSFRRRVLVLQLRAWLTFIVAFVIGFAITAVVWTIVAGRDVQTMLTLLQTVLTFLTLVAALVALKYARDSARAALETVRPMEAMARDLATAATTLKGMEERLATTADTMKMNLTLAERSRHEDRLIHRLEQYERVMLAVQKMAEGRRRQDSGRNVEYFEEARAELQAALSVILDPRLSACRTLADGTFVQATLDAARAEIKNALSRDQAELGNLTGV